MKTETNPIVKGNVALCAGSVKVIYFPEADLYLVDGERCRSKWMAERIYWDKVGGTFTEAAAAVSEARMDGFRDLRDIQAVARC